MRKKIEDKWAEIVGLPIEQHVNVLGDKNRYIDTAIQAVIEEVEGVENPHRVDLNPCEWGLFEDARNLFIRRLRDEA